MAFIAVPLSFRQIRPPRRTQRPRRRQDGNLWTCCYAAQSSMTRPAAEPAEGATLRPIASGYAQSESQSKVGLVGGGSLDVTIVSRVTQHSDRCDNPTNGTSLINLKVLCPKCRRPCSRSRLRR